MLQDWGIPLILSSHKEGVKCQIPPAPTLVPSQLTLLLSPRQVVTPMLLSGGQYLSSRSYKRQQNDTGYTDTASSVSMAAFLVLCMLSCELFGESLSLSRACKWLSHMNSFPKIPGNKTRYITSHMRSSCRICCPSRTELSP